MTPQKRKKANVQEILKNPVQSNQKPLFKQKEGIWGWLSYIGWALTIVFPLIVFLYNLMSYYSSFDFLFLESWTVNLMVMLLGILITTVNIWKSKYPLSNKCRNVVSLTFGLMIFFEFIFSPSNYNLMYFFLWLWSFLFFWYLHYFYRKSKDAYRKVWLKVILFTIIPMLSLSYLDYYDPVTDF